MSTTRKAPASRATSWKVTLRLLAQSGARRIDIVAHSMGTWVTMEALRQLALSGDRDLGGKLGDVVLASPDIDVDVFKSQMRRYGKPDRPFFLMLSADDRALKLSGIIAGNRPRVGDYGDPADLAELWRRRRRPLAGEGRRQPQPHQIRRQSGTGETARPAAAGG